MKRARIGLLLTMALIAFMVPRPGRCQGTLSAMQTEVDEIARAARPSVVTVVTQNTVVTRGRRGAPARSHLRTRVGSGIAVEENAVITTASVVLGAEHLSIRTTNDLQVDARLV